MPTSKIEFKKTKSYSFLSGAAGGGGDTTHFHRVSGVSLLQKTQPSPELKVEERHI